MKTAQKLKRASSQVENLTKQHDIENAIKSTTDPNTLAYLQRELEKAKGDSINRIRSNVTEYNGVKYRSGLEAYFAMRCDDAGLPFVRQVIVTLQEEVTVFKKKVPAIKIHIDFLVGGFAFVDPKGMLMPDFELKWRMLQNKFREDYEYYLPNTKKEIRELVDLLRTKHNM